MPRFALTFIVTTGEELAVRFDSQRDFDNCYNEYLNGKKVIGVEGWQGVCIYRGHHLANINSSLIIGVKNILEQQAE